MGTSLAVETCSSRYARILPLLSDSSLMGCNVGQYLPVDDSPVEEVERIVHLPMMAQQGQRRGHRHAGSFIPPQNIELVVTTHKGHTLHITGYCVSELEECHLSLHFGRRVLRKFEAHDDHYNPRRRNHPIDRTHMHFPSAQFPLVENKSSYAYSISDGGFDDIAEGLLCFCDELGIELGVWQPFLRCQ